MKNILKTICVSFLILGMTGCDDFLTVNPQDSLVADNYYVSAEAIRQNTASLYASGSVWRDVQMCFMWMAGDELAGDLYYTYDQEGQFYYASFGANNTYSTQGWTGLYRVIGFCNTVINDMPPAAEANGVSDADIQQGVAEARCIRAIAYYYLTEFWGDVTIIENNAKMMNEKLYRHQQKDVYEFMRRDLDFAASVLPASDSQKGRVTKWTAYGMLAKLHLTMASHLSDANSAENFELAKTYALKVIRDSGLNIYPDYSTMFDISANNSEESLFAIQCMVGGYGYGSSRNVSWSRGSVIADQTWGAGKGPTLSLQACYDNADRRRKWVYMTLGDTYPNLNKAGGGYTYNFVTRDGTGTQIETPNPMLAHVKKYVIGKSADTDGGVGDAQDAANNIYLLRLSDVYLVYVEACIGAGTSTSDAVAVEVFNQIHHDRAGLASVSSISFDQLIKERRCEFAFESINFFDVKRMYYRDATSAVNYLNGMQRHRAYLLDTTDVSTENTRAGYPEDTSVYPITTTASQMNLPIPGSELTAMPTLGDAPIAYY